MAVLSLTLFACHPADHPVNAPVSRRMALIDALKELRARIVSGDKAQIGRIFNFPVPDSVFHPYFGDSLFQARIEKNGDAITEGMFNAYFDKISGAAELEGFKSIFSFIDLDSLQNKDSIDVDTALANDNASRIYWIHIRGDSLVGISYGTGHCLTEAPAADTAAGGGAVKDTAMTVTPAKDSVGTEDDNGEDDPSACEHIAFWHFSFDGKTLRLLHQGSAD